MNLLTPDIEQEIKNYILVPLSCDDSKQPVLAIENVLQKMYTNIPDNKRISYGKVHTVKVLSKYIFENRVCKENVKRVFEQSESWHAKSTALGVLSFFALNGYEMILPYFEKAASDENWDVREMAQMFFRKLIKKYPGQMQAYLIKLTQSKDENIRRFVSETVRPVCENRWFQNNPDYSLIILRNLFKEKKAYPRTSVGNNLSDLARQNKELIYKIVEELVESGDKNSYWVAYRACRNLVKKEPVRVMDLLKVNEYKYKNNIYKRSGKRD